MNVVERVITIDEGEDAPAGWEVVRILRESARNIGPGANYVTVYTVAIRKTVPGSLTGDAAPRSAGPFDAPTLDVG